MSVPTPTEVDALYEASEAAYAAWTALCRRVDTPQGREAWAAYDEAWAAYAEAWAAYLDGMGRMAQAVALGMPQERVQKKEGVEA